MTSLCGSGTMLANASPIGSSGRLVEHQPPSRRPRRRSRARTRCRAGRRRSPSACSSRRRSTRRAPRARIETRRSLGAKASLEGGACPAGVGGRIGHAVAFDTSSRVPPPTPSGAAAALQAAADRACFRTTERSCVCQAVLLVRVLSFLCLAPPSWRRQAAPQRSDAGATRRPRPHESQAAQIINYRTENGDFLQVEELLAVPQISRPTFDKVRDKLTVDE